MASNEIDPRFFLPPGVVDLSYSDTTLPSSDAPVQENEEQDITMEFTEGGYVVSPEDYTPNDENALYPPDSVTVVSQTVKVTSGGSVVDVIIDVQSAGATQFEVRVTK